MGGFFFAVLLCFKHLFAVAAPVYFVYLLRHYCSRGGLFKCVYWEICVDGNGGWGGFLSGIRTIFVLWTDKGLAFVLTRLGFNIQMPAPSFTGGLVGDLSPFALLPQVTPLSTFALVILAISSCLFKAWRDPRTSRDDHKMGSLLLHLRFFLWMACTREGIPPYLNTPCRCCNTQLGGCKTLFLAIYIGIYAFLLHSLLMWSSFTSHFSRTAALKASAPIQTEKIDAKNSEGRKTASHTKESRLNVGWVGQNYLLGLLAVEICHMGSVSSTLPS